MAPPDSHGPQRIAQDVDEELLTLHRSLYTSDLVATDSHLEPLELHQWKWLNDALIRRDWQSTFRQVIASIPPPSEETKQSPKTIATPNTSHSRSLGSPWASASTRIPPELFNEILYHVSAEYRGQRFITLSKYSNHELKSMFDPIATCSLVCLYWANQCRKFAFSDAIIKLSSFEEAGSFARYATQGCSSLFPVHKLIRSLWVEQRYDAPFSFYRHLLPHLSIMSKDKSAKLWILGPIPDDFAPDQLDTPCWGPVPASAPRPSLRPYWDIRVEHIHLPSFAHAARYIQHFEKAGMNTFDYLTWDGERDDPIDSRRRDLVKFHLGSNLFVHASNCTNNFRLCLKVAASHQWSVAHLVRDDEWSWIVSLLVWAEGVFSCDELPSCMLTTDCPAAPQLGSPFTLDILFDTEHEDWWWQLDLVFNDQPTPNPSMLDLCVVGCRVSLNLRSFDEEEDTEDTENTENNENEDVWHIDVLLTHLRKFAMLRIVSLCFGSNQELRAAMERYGALLTGPQVDNFKFAIAYHCPLAIDHQSPDDDYAYEKIVGVDLTTLTPNGQVWLDRKDVVPSLLASL